MYQMKCLHKFSVSSDTSFLVAVFEVVLWLRGQGIFPLRIYASSACYSRNGMRAGFSLHGQNAQNQQGCCCPITAEIF